MTVGLPRSGVTFASGRIAMIRAMILIDPIGDLYARAEPIRKWLLEIPLPWMVDDAVTGVLPLYTKQPDFVVVDFTEAARTQGMASNAVMNLDKIEKWTQWAGKDVLVLLWGVDTEGLRPCLLLSSRFINSYEARGSIMEWFEGDYETV